MGEMGADGKNCAKHTGLHYYVRARGARRAMGKTSYTRGAGGGVWIGTKRLRARAALEVSL